MKGSLASDTAAKPLSVHGNVVGRSSADNSTRAAHMASPRVSANVCKTCAPELHVLQLKPEVTEISSEATDPGTNKMKSREQDD